MLLGCFFFLEVGHWPSIWKTQKSGANSCLSLFFLFLLLFPCSFPPLPLYLFFTFHLVLNQHAFFLPFGKMLHKKNSFHWGFYFFFFSFSSQEQWSSALQPYMVKCWLLWPKTRKRERCRGKETTWLIKGRGRARENTRRLSAARQERRRPELSKHRTRRRVEPRTRAVANFQTRPFWLGWPPSRHTWSRCLTLEFFFLHNTAGTTWPF